MEFGKVKIYFSTVVAFLLFAFIAISVIGSIKLDLAREQTKQLEIQYANYIKKGE